MTATHSHANAYARTQTAIYVADKLGNIMKKLVIDTGLDPTILIDGWSNWVYNAARRLMETGHLNSIVIEFFVPGSNTASGRWDFPVRYDGNGIDEVWVDMDYFRATFGKAPRPPANCTYRVLVVPAPGAPDVGLTFVSFKSLGNLTAREAGTVIATPDIMASAVYYK